MKKRIFVGLIAVLLVVTLAGCGGNAGGEDEAVLTRGSWTDGTYTNEFLEERFTKPEGWVEATDEELAEMMNTSVDLLGEVGVEVNETLMNLTLIFDMMAQDPMTGNNVIIQVQNLGKLNQTNISETDYLDSSKDSLAEMGYVFSDYSTEEMAGKTYTTSVGSVTSSGFELKQYFYIRKVGKYMESIIVTIVDDTDISTITSNFH